MGNIIIAFAIVALTATACNNGSGSASETGKKEDSSQGNASTGDAATSNTTDQKVDAAMKEMVSQYLQLKNALANDNGKDAATAGNALVASIDKMDTTSLAAEKKATWSDIAGDAKEMAEHIGTNANNIEHQREHFDMLSKDMYDIVKAFGAGQTLYQDFCPMYNDKKGATWLSEVKEIKNPYLGKKMPTCGSVKEELK